MAVKKATPKDLEAKVEAAVKAETPKAEAPKAEAKKAETKAAPKKAAAKAEVKEEVKKAPVKKAPAKKAAPKKAAEPKVAVVIEYAGGQVSTADIVAKAIEVSGKKTVKEINVYYQPENGKVYFTADGEQGSFDL